MTGTNRRAKCRMDRFNAMGGAMQRGWVGCAVWHPAAGCGIRRRGAASGGGVRHPAAGCGSGRLGAVIPGEPSGAAGSIRDNGAVKLYRDEAIVLRTHKLGEADRIVTMLTRRYGQVRGVAKGVRRTSSKFGARLETFSVIDVQLHIGRSLDVITQVETLAPHGRALGADYSRYTTATAMVEAAARLTDVAGEPTTQQYLLLAGALSALAEGRHPNSLTLDSYLLRALAI